MNTGRKLVPGTEKIFVKNLTLRLTQKALTACLFYFWCHCFHWDYFKSPPNGIYFTSLIPFQPVLCHAVRMSFLENKPHYAISNLLVCIDQNNNSCIPLRVWENLQVPRVEKCTGFTCVHEPLNLFLILEIIPMPLLPVRSQQFTLTFVWARNRLYCDGLCLYSPHVTKRQAEALSFSSLFPWHPAQCHST